MPQGTVYQSIRPVRVVSPHPCLFVISSVSLLQVSSLCSLHLSSPSMFLVTTVSSVYYPVFFHIDFDVISQFNFFKRSVTVQSSHICTFLVSFLVSQSVQISISLNRFFLWSQDPKLEFNSFHHPLILTPTLPVLGQSIHQMMSFSCGRLTESPDRFFFVRCI